MQSSKQHFFNHAPIPRIHYLCVSDPDINHVELLHIYNTTILSRKINGNINMESSSSYWETTHFERELEGKKYYLYLDSILGSENRHALIKIFCGNTDVILLFFSHENASSLENIPKWHNEIKQYNKNVIFYMIGLGNPNFTASRHLAEIENELNIRYFSCPTNNPTNVMNTFNAIFNDTANRLILKPQQIEGKINTHKKKRCAIM